MNIRRSLCYLFLIAGLLLIAGCCPTAEMTELPPRYDNQSPEQIIQVPVILVAVVKDANWSGGFHLSRFDEPTPVRRRRVRVKIENVLQGTVAQKEVDVSFFVWARSLGIESQCNKFADWSSQNFFPPERRRSAANHK